MSETVRYITDDAGRPIGAPIVSQVNRLPIVKIRLWGAWQPV
jgi:hypothetical protein